MGGEGAWRLPEVLRPFAECLLRDSWGLLRQRDAGRVWVELAALLAGQAHQVQVPLEHSQGSITPISDPPSQGSSRTPTGSPDPPGHRLWAEAATLH